ncbi:uncharacterized protein METZ01_LOCUS301941 [marine metagenome]|uniref:Uncharacterized protein n=1 Tax=marine metagenome TaxID=408172 RepID=A0A382MMS1_9ZZZZ
MMQSHKTDRDISSLSLFYFNSKTDLLLVQSQSYF